MTTLKKFYDKWVYFTGVNEIDGIVYVIDMMYELRFLTDPGLNIQ